IGVVTRAGIRVANNMYLSADVVTVMLHSMLLQLERDYGATNAVHNPHGSYGVRVQTPPRVKQTALSFGFWGAVKDADLLVGAIEDLRETGVDAELVLGGGPHPYHPEIYHEMVERYRGHRYVRFTGHVPENELDGLFCSSSVVVLPYKNN